MEKDTLLLALICWKALIKEQVINRCTPSNALHAFVSVWHMLAMPATARSYRLEL